MTNNFDQPPDEFNPDSWDFDSELQNLASDDMMKVREDYGFLTNRNQEVFEGFNPDDEKDLTELPLTAGTESEVTEPQLAVLGRQKMLKDLGLDYHPLEKNDPDTIFNFTYGNGVEQVRYITRQDGVRVPVMLAVKIEQKGEYEAREVVGVTLIPTDKVEEVVGARKDAIEEAHLEERLTGEEFGLDEELIKKTDLSLDDKRSMLEAFDAIQELDIAMPDINALASMREKLAKAMLGKSKMFGKLEDVKALKAAYEQQVSELVKHYDEQTAHDFVESERLLRLQALNEQLRHRQRSKKFGSIAITSLSSLVTSGLGAAAEVIGRALHDDDVKPPLTGAVAGAALGGVALGLERYSQHRKEKKLMRGFNGNSYFSDGRSILTSHLAQEERIARSYDSQLNR